MIQQDSAAHVSLSFYHNVKERTSTDVKMRRTIACAIDRQILRVIQISPKNRSLL
jgi:hypothetical protein